MNDSKRRRLLENADPERGNCILLYMNEVRPFTILDESDQKEVAVQFFRWFLNMPSQNKPKMSVPARNCLQIFIDAQKEHAVEFFERSAAKSQAARIREAKKKACMGNPAQVTPSGHPSTAKGTPQPCTPVHNSAQPCTAVH